MANITMLYGVDQNMADRIDNMFSNLDDIAKEVDEEYIGSGCNVAEAIGYMVGRIFDVPVEVLKAREVDFQGDDVEKLLMAKMEEWLGSMQGNAVVYRLNEERTIQ